MGKYSREVVAEVLAANDIVEVIGGSLELKPSGSARFVALCPFHQEKTPSFSVNRERQMFYCFGCEKSGDLLSFLQEYEGLTFVEALQKLADRAGIVLPAPTERQDGEGYTRLRLQELGRFAAKFFRETLEDPLKGGRGRTYLKGRQLSEDAPKQFNLGYAPDSWDAFINAARAAGFKDKVLIESGLVKQGERGRCYDFFRNRLMFPIRDVAGNYVAFGGRDLGGETQAKYINSRENALYKKSRVLYGLHEARNALRHEKRALLVEGYFDVLRCHDAGLGTALAPCGTALTPEQAKLMARYVREVAVVFDGDAAGIRAALRGIGILAGAGLAVRAVALPDNQDPDEFVLAQGAEAFREMVERAPDFVTFYVRMNEGRLESIEGRTDVAKELFGILAAMDDMLRRDEYLKRVASLLRLSMPVAQREFSRFLRQRTGRESVPAREEMPKTPSLREDDGAFLAVVLSKEPLREYVREQLQGIELEPSPLAEVLEALLQDAGADLASRLKGRAARALYAAAANWIRPERDDAEPLVRKRVVSLKREALSAQARRLQEAIQQADRDNDMARVMELLAQKMKLEKEIQGMDAA